jgi:penicillin-binding protein 2
VQGAYPPGSTFKMVPALAALESGVASPEDTVYCPGVTVVSGIRFHCWSAAARQRGLHQSLVVSCDCYYYEWASARGSRRSRTWPASSGIGVRHDVPMSAVAEASPPTPNGSSACTTTCWRVGDTVNASIGQGYVPGDAAPARHHVRAHRHRARGACRASSESINGVEQPRARARPGLNENWLRRVRAYMSTW